jgi:hypothetical protein
MSWIKLTSPSGRLQFFNSENLIVFRSVSGLEAAEGAHAKLWMQSGCAQVKETPADILKLLDPGWIAYLPGRGAHLFQSGQLH